MSAGGLDITILICLVENVPNENANKLIKQTKYVLSSAVYMPYNDKTDPRPISAQKKESITVGL